MQNWCRYSRPIAEAIILALLAVTVAQPVSAQKEVQVMVSGPWSYVTDFVAYPGRLFLVANGKSKHHHVYLLPGTDPRIPKTGTPTPYPVGSYALDPQSYTKDTYGGTDGYTPTLCGGAISSPETTVRQILQNANKSNYVISLPMPDALSTSPDPMGTSKSEVSTSHIPDPSSATERHFTTWMVLHYGVSTIPANFSVNGGVKTISTTGASNASSGGISITLADDPNDPDSNNLKCDNISIESVVDFNDLWSFKLYARFPEEDQYGSQPGPYHKECSDSDPTVHPFAAPKVAREGIVSTGSADCHACQVSINSAVPGAVVPVTASK